jgi:hypothetical protein
MLSFGESSLFVAPVPEYEQSQAAGWAFLHPGMLQSTEDLRRMRKAVQSRRGDIYAGFERLRDDFSSRLTYRPAGASAEIGRNPNVRFTLFDADCNAAYQCALMGHITGDPDFFQMTRRILDDWSATLQRITGADAVLCAGLGGFKMANAAELLRHSDAGWPEQNARRFGALLRNVFLPILYNFAPFANGNWDTAAMKTMMAIAVYTDDRRLFDRAVSYYTGGCGDGQLTHYIYPNGQCQESGRDQQHTQLGIAHMGDCCEMAWHQGIDLYGMLENRLLTGFEYTAKYNLGGDVPFVPDMDQTGKYRHTVNSPRGSLRPVYEQIYNHYTKRRGVDAPWTARAAAKLRPDGAAFQADHTGFGSLLYTRESGPDVRGFAAGSTTSGMRASIAGGEVQLDWVPLAEEVSYTVQRSERGSTFTTVGHGIREHRFIDASAKSGQEYEYRVVPPQPARVSSPVRAMAGLPKGWQSTNVGAEVLNGSAFCDGEVWRLNAAGTDAETAADSCYFIYANLDGDGVLTARLLPPLASQLLQIGLALRSSTTPNSANAALLLAPTVQESRERPRWAASLYAYKQAGARRELVGEQFLSQPFTTYGRVIAGVWLRVQRLAGSVIASISSDGQAWTEVGNTGDIAGPMLAGVVLNSGIAGVATEVLLDHLALTRA